MTRNIAVLAVVVIMFFGCATAAEHQQSLGSAQERAMTVGVVQKEIKVGMSQADVATALGSPNIVTKDSEGNETWIYDKIATEASYSKSGANTGVIVSLFVGGSSQSGAASSTQRTLTVVIKYDQQGRVASTSYHTSKF